MKDWLQMATARLHDYGMVESARLDAELLACKVSGLGRTGLFAHPETSLSLSQTEQLNRLLERRCQGEPVAYLTGKRAFWSFELDVSPGALIPRPETELLVETALSLVRHSPAGPIVDLGTGTGAIAIALALEIPDRSIIAVERSAAAAQIAAQNCRQHTPDGVTLLRADWLSGFAGNSLAMAVTNPPYLAEHDPHLQSLSCEPVEALVSGPEGMDDLQRIARDFVRTGKPGAPLLLEHGFDQGARVRSTLHSCGYREIDTVVDLEQRERVSYGFLPETRPLS
ncbi:MAG: peptide chain release factor N(5)-glutamine methyltransferase [Granulosicoccus sp.]